MWSPRSLRLRSGQAGQAGWARSSSIKARQTRRSGSCARAATLYAEAAENYDTIGLVLYASRLAEKRARLPFV